MTTLRPLETGWLDDTPVEDSLLRRFLFNQADLQETLVRAAGGRVDRTADVALAHSGLPVPYLNQGILLRPLTGDDDPAIDDVGAFYDSPSLLLSAWPTPDLTSRGWALIGHPMFVARGPVSQRASYDGSPPPDVSVRVAQTADDLALCVRIVVDGYPMPEAAGLPADRMLGAGLLDSAVVHRLGYLDRRPVAMAASHVAHGVTNLCLAATLPAARRRGVWQALVDARCADAPDLPAVAFTSDDSRPGFVRAGFLPVQRFTLWLVC